MAKERAAMPGGFVQEIFRLKVYKPSQGRITRQVTWASLAVVAILAAWVGQMQLGETDWERLQYVLPGALLVAGTWAAYRLVNYPRFADFLIAVEAEMKKVSWPNRNEEQRSTIVVAVVTFVLAILLFAFDWMLQGFFRLIIRA